MKIILFSRPKGFNHSNNDIAEIFSAIERHGFEYMVNEEFADFITSLTGRHIPAECRYGESVGECSGDAVMVCYGGDGTLLDGVHRLGGCNVPVVGINSGRLGFLALAPRSEIARVFDDIASGGLCVERRAMLCAEGEFDGREQLIYALNEVSVQRLGATMTSVETYIDDQYTSTCAGDGVIVATPTGSTAYSLSAGGPIVAPSCRCIVLTPLSPHNLTMRPIVMGEQSSIELLIRTRNNAASISADNRTFEVRDGAKIRIKIAERFISLAVPHNISFFDTLRNKMMWGVDIR